MAVFILVENWPDNIEVVMTWVSVVKMSRRWYGIQITGGRFRAFYYSIVIVTG